MTREQQGICYGALAAFLNSLIAILIKLSATVPNETMVFIRFFIGFLILFPFYIRGKIKLTRIHFPKHLVRAVLGLCSIYFYYFALKRLPVANAISFANTMPLFTPFVILIWLKLLVSKWKFISAGIGFLGVLLMLNPSQFTFEPASFSGLGTGLCAAIVFVGIRQLSKVELIHVILFYYFSIATIISFFPCMYSWEPILEWKLWIYLICMGVLGMLFQFLLTLAFSMAPSSKAGLTVYLAVLFGGLWGWLIWGEVPTIVSSLGMGLIVLGGTMAMLDNTPSRELK